MLFTFYCFIRFKRMSSCEHKAFGIDSISPVKIQSVLYQYFSYINLNFNNRALELELQKYMCR